VKGSIAGAWLNANDVPSCSGQLASILSFSFDLLDRAGEIGALAMGLGKLELKKESALGQKQTLLPYPDNVRFRGYSGLYLGRVEMSAFSQKRTLDELIRI